MARKVKTTINKFPKVALIGLGMWGMNWLRSLRTIGCPVSVFDKNTEVAGSVSGLCKIPKILNKKTLGGVQGAILATPAETHFELAKKIIRSGLHVLVEKPLALRTQEAKELIRMAEKNKVVLMTGHLLDYHPLS